MIIIIDFVDFQIILQQKDHIFYVQNVGKLLAMIKEGK